MVGVYIHIPFCLKKCKYCDFVSFEGKTSCHKAYIEALIAEMRKYEGMEADSVFIGGGTPTAIEADLLEKLLKACNSNFILSSNCEFSIEANPKTLTDEKLSVMKKGGINRISVGVQSFNDHELCVLGRIHTAEDAYNTVCGIKEYGFSNINIDLMFGLPFQTADTFAHSLNMAAKCNPTHISCYSLILEEGTILEKEYGSGKFTLPSEDEDRRMYDYAHEFLHSYGYGQYEISNFAKAGVECTHNIKYWECMDYIGLGVCAHSLLDGIRFCNTDDLKAYISGETKSESLILTEKDKMEEFMIMGLRMRKGISEHEFFRRFGKDIRKIYGNVLDTHIKNGFIRYADGRYRLSFEAISVSNSVLCDFIL
ncbi:MAG: radical SAM family heme chaperone HemW [Clostridia bacterium]|nr:radical SAM family heme chaperone HemW [Clostridia bacterium]